ncbi:aminotransferase class V-fold PLP-dependent enzyme [Haloferax namakaokahaiae]|uniref:cysteine desulfurase n=1 Tax=Haloferax namakaokahaiae TaxID=1748331 RepID=A0ABD5ZK26_9EURY
MDRTAPDTLNAEAIREDFPILDRKIGGSELVYLDNGATSQTPQQVIEAIVDYYTQYNANIHRGLHTLSQEASIAYEEAHDTVADFIGADGREEIVFTKNTTEAQNLVAYSWGMNELGPGDEIVLTQMEHHASLVTWQQMCKRTGAEVKYIPITNEGYLDMEAAESLVTDDTKLVSVSHVSNTLGTINPVDELAAIAHDHGAYLFVDGAQSVPTRPVDVGALDADFLAFSGHKMCGPTGSGALYGKKEILEEIEPAFYGGGMIRKVEYEDSTWHDLPWKFEAGTPGICEGIALAAACEYLSDIGMERVQSHEESLAEYAYDQLARCDDVEIFGPPGNDRTGLVSFDVEGIHPHDLSSIVNEHGVAIRAGDHCTQPLHGTLGVPASARASFYIYNTHEEIDVLVDVLHEAREIFH